MTKFVSLSALIAVFAAPAFAGGTEYVAPAPTDIPSPQVGFGGYVAASYAGVAGNAEGDYGTGDDFYAIALEGSVGSAGNGGFGWQVDVNGAIGTFPDGSEFYETYGATLHANFGLGGFIVGGFVGGGVGNNIEDTDAADMYWYGVEAARDFGNFTVAAQVGLATSDNDHNSLDFENGMFGGIQGRYFVNDNLMITADIGAAMGIIHSDDFRQTTYGIEAMMRLGQSNFYGTAAYRGAYMNGDINGGSEGQGGEQGFEIGIAMLFGGGDLRDTYAGSTPMINNTALTILGVNTATYD